MFSLKCEFHHLLTKKPHANIIRTRYVLRGCRDRYISILPQSLALQSTVPMNYYTVFHHVSQLLPHDCIIISEGANTMDIGRTMLNNYLPRHRQARRTTAAFTGAPSLTRLDLNGRVSASLLLWSADAT